jgi:hypothetical protein
MRPMTYRQNLGETMWGHGDLLPMKIRACSPIERFSRLSVSDCESSLVSREVDVDGSIDLLFYIYTEQKNQRIIVLTNAQN